MGELLYSGKGPANVSTRITGWKSLLDYMSLSSHLSKSILEDMVQLQSRVVDHLQREEKRCADTAANREHFLACIPAKAYTLLSGSESSPSNNIAGEMRGPNQKDNTPVTRHNAKLRAVIRAFGGGKANAANAIRPSRPATLGHSLAPPLKHRTTLRQVFRDKNESAMTTPLEGLPLRTHPSSHATPVASSSLSTSEPIQSIPPTPDDTASAAAQQSETASESKNPRKSSKNARKKAAKKQKAALERQKAEDEEAVLTAAAEAAAAAAKTEEIEPHLLEDSLAELSNCTDIEAFDLLFTSATIEVKMEYIWRLTPGNMTALNLLRSPLDTFDPESHPIITEKYKTIGDFDDKMKHFLQVMSAVFTMRWLDEMDEFDEEDRPEGWDDWHDSLASGTGKVSGLAHWEQGRDFHSWGTLVEEILEERNKKEGKVKGMPSARSLTNVAPFAEKLRLFTAFDGDKKIKDMGLNLYVSRIAMICKENACVLARSRKEAVDASQTIGLASCDDPVWAGAW